MLLVAAEPMAFPVTIGAGDAPRSSMWSSAGAHARFDWYAIGKRSLDIVAAAVLLLALLPVFLVVAVAIGLDSGWPFIYCAERVGRNGRSFFCLKFRSMVVNAGPSAHRQFVRGLMCAGAHCSVYKA